MSDNTGPVVASQVEDDLTDKWANRIRKMLERAEGAGTAEEAETYTTRAMELMEKYGIEEAMLGRTKERADDVIESLVIKHTGIYRMVKKNITFAVIRGVGAKGYYSDMNYGRGKYTAVHAFGFTSDIARIELLDASLQLQCTMAMTVWEKERGALWGERSSFNKFKDRREFIDSFASGVSSKMRIARTTAVKEAAAERATETGETVEETTTGMELALRDRTERVKDWFDRTHGQGLRAGTNRRTSGSAGAATAGYDAGTRADTGTNTVTGARRALGQ